MATLRRPKWTPPPPQTPRILQLPRRTTRRKPPSRNPSHIFRQPTPAAKLATLFDQEREPPVVLLNSGRRERVVLDDVEERESTSGDVEERERRSSSEDEEKWRFQAEMLRAECYLLRMEREVVVKKLENERFLLQHCLNSVIHTLISGKKKIGEGENVSSVLEEEIEELSKKLVELQRRSSRLKSPELQNCRNFDKQAFELQKQLEDYNEINHSGGCIEDSQELTGTSLQPECSAERKIKAYAGFSNRPCIKPADVETLRRKMERLSKGRLLKRMEEVYGSMLSATNCSLPSSASSSRRYDLADLSFQSSQEAKSGELKACSGQCKAIVMRLMEQVKAETDQWSQMQQMLGQVRDEMEELQTSRDFWETRALESDCQIQTLHSEVEEWKQKTVSSKIKEKELHKHVQQLQLGVEKLRVPETCETKPKVSTNSTTLSLGAQLAKEKLALTCRVKERKPRNENIENKEVDYSEVKRSTLYRDGSSRPVPSFNRLPFKDIGNLASIGKQNSRRYVYPLHNPKDS
ncbi:hypothetical protein RND81_12G180700 [Saponaria officinalis]|uniref:Uncharacterized protein n=1 Tax=Saponaria officinalis TaxID=3572 RepID=A0AAW1HC35_SAPOF